MTQTLDRQHQPENPSFAGDRLRRQHGGAGRELILLQLGQSGNQDHGPATAAAELAFDPVVAEDGADHESEEEILEQRGLASDRGRSLIRG